MVRLYRGKPVYNPGFNRNTGNYFGKGIYKGGKKRMRLYRKGRQAVRTIFKKRYNPAKFAKWRSKY